MRQLSGRSVRAHERGIRRRRSTDLFQIAEADQVRQPLAPRCGVSPRVGWTCPTAPRRGRGVQFLFPSGNHYSSDAVADEVRGGPDFREEPIDTEDERKPCHRNCGHDGQRRCEVMKLPPKTPAMPFEVSIATPSSDICCCHVRPIFIACAMNSAAIVR